MVLSYNYSRSEQKLTFHATAHSESSKTLILLVRGITWHNGLQVQVTSNDVAREFGEMNVESSGECRVALRKMGRGYCKGEEGEMWIRPGNGSLGVIVEINNLIPL